MESNEKVITQFETRVKQLILKFQELKKENQDLYAMVEKTEQEVKDLQAKLTQKDNDYNALKMAKMMTITDGDLEAAKARIQKLIREVNKCITLVSDEKLTIKSE
jgi:predicted RNase H-like nuclease (RuvC/YqgF family)